MKIIALLFTFLLMISAVYSLECDYSAEILLESNEFATKDFKFKVKAAKLEGPPTNITGRVFINDEYGNTTKSYKPWTNISISKQKTSSEYSPNLKEGNYEITAEISVLCDDFGKENNIDKRKITIKQPIPEYIAAKNKAKPKENENPAPFSVYINKSDEITVIQSSAAEEKIYAQNQEAAKEKNTSPELQENQIYTKENTINRQLTENRPTGNIVYESSNEKSKELMVYMLLGISILLNIALIWRRKLGMP